MGPSGGQNSFGQLIARHSQAQYIPECPSNTVKLWSGYSLLYLTYRNENSVQQDLGSAGSCLVRFSSMPFFQCDTDNSCSYTRKEPYDLSYWLSTSEPIPISKQPIEDIKIQQYISRCSVCDTSSNVIAVHSQNETLPNCPTNWNVLWTGYSFLMV